MARAASTNWNSRRLSTCERTIRTMRGVSTTVMTMMTLVTELPSMAIRARASSSVGNDISASMKRWIIMSALRS